MKKLLLFLFLFSSLAQAQFVRQFNSSSAPPTNCPLNTLWATTTTLSACLANGTYLTLGTGTISGSGTTTQLPYWASSTSLAGIPTATYNSTTKGLSLASGSTATDGTNLTLASGPAIGGNDSAGDILLNGAVGGGSSGRGGDIIVTPGSGDTNGTFQVVGDAAVSGGISIIGDIIARGAINTGFAGVASGIIRLKGTTSGTATLTAAADGSSLSLDKDFILSTMTSGSALFAGTAGLLSQNNANFFWNTAAPVGLFIGPRTGFDTLIQNSYVATTTSAHSILNALSATSNTPLMGIIQDNTTNYGFGVYGVTESNNTSGTRPMAVGLNGDAYHTGAGGTVTTLGGVSGLASVTTGTVTNVGAFVGNGVGLSGGTVGTAADFLGGGVTVSGATVTNAIGALIRTNNRSSGTLTNNYGLFIENQAAGGTINSAIKTGTGTIDFGGNIMTSGGIANVEKGVPASRNIYTSTANTANIASTAFTPAITSAVAGRYRLSCYVAVTQQATTSSTVPTCNLLCTDPTDSVAKVVQVTPLIAGVAVNPATTVAESGAGICDAKVSTGITISTTGYLSVGATPMAYKVYAILEAM